MSQSSFQNSSSNYLITDHEDVNKDINDDKEIEREMELSKSVIETNKESFSESSIVGCSMISGISQRTLSRPGDFSDFVRKKIHLLGEGSILLYPSLLNQPASKNMKPS